jgi:hypothetical protein
MEDGKMRCRTWIIVAATGIVILSFVTSAFTAYHHMGEVDSGIFISVHPDKAGTKLDSCNLCHTGGTNAQGVTLGSCQWCHSSYGYDGHGNIDDTLNSYGLAYKENGRNIDAVGAIEDLDSDDDGFTNGEEIAATRYPGDPNDDPSKITAPYRIFTLAQLEGMREHGQFLLMNASKSTDFYAEYSGVLVSDLLKRAGMLPSATGVRVYAPDGFSQSHPLGPVADPSLYHVNGEYPEAYYHYSGEADFVLHPESGWCDYSAPSCAGRTDGQLIENEHGLRMILAITRDEQYLTPGVLNPQNKLDGEGPFRVVPPQKNPGPPDQRSNANNQNVIWPYQQDGDHNAGFSTRSATIIRVEPIPEGTTDVDVLEAGWNYVDEKKIIVYGAINPVPTVKQKLNDLLGMLHSMEAGAFKHPVFKRLLEQKVRVVQKMVKMGHYKAALWELQQGILLRTDGCTVGGTAHRHDWVVECDSQKQVYWSIHEIAVLLDIVA